MVDRFQPEIVPIPGRKAVGRVIDDHFVHGAGQELRQSLCCNGPNPPSFETKTSSPETRRPRFPKLVFCTASV